MTSTKKTINKANKPAKATSQRGGARPGSGRKPKSIDPEGVWRGGRHATRGDVRGRRVQAIAATEVEAEHWRMQARESGMSLELFFASVLRATLGSPT